MITYWRSLVQLWKSPVKIATAKGGKAIWTMSAAKSKFLVGYMSWTLFAGGIAVLYVSIIGTLNIYDWIANKRIKLWLPWVDA